MRTWFLAFVLLAQGWASRMPTPSPSSSSDVECASWVEALQMMNSASDFTNCTVNSTNSTVNLTNATARARRLAGSSANVSNTTNATNATNSSANATTNVTGATNATKTMCAAPICRGNLFMGDTVIGDTSFSNSFLGNNANDQFWTLHMTEDAVACANDGRMWISTCGSKYDTWLRLYSFDGATEIYSCDDCGDCDAQTVMNVPPDLTAGANYVLLVEGFSSGSGEYTLSVSCATPTSMPTPMPSLSARPSPLPSPAPTVVPSVSAAPTGSALVTDFSELKSAIDANNEHITIASNIAFATSISMTGKASMFITSGHLTSVVLDGGGSTQFFYISSSVVTFSGLEFRNGASSYGGNFRLSYGAAVSINSCALIGATAYQGAAIYASSRTTIRIKNSVIANNTASNEGGALMVTYGSVAVEDSTFLSNSAGASGGAAACHYCSLTATHTLFKGNSAAGWGGAFYIGHGGGGDVSVQWSKFVQNFGGGGAVRNSGTFAAEATYFADNGRGGYDVTGEDTINCPSTCPAFSAGNCTEANGLCYSCSCVDLNPTQYPTSHPTPHPTHPTQLPTPAASPTPAPIMLISTAPTASMEAQCIDCGRRLTGRTLLFGYLNCC